ncbi:MAG: hypothetical protein JXA52_06350, partial [Planctomycetes bacterium]|nr:hypothetical protein [Planctomycetota bacterium]
MIKSQLLRPLQVLLLCLWFSICLMAKARNGEAEGQQFFPTKIQMLLADALDLSRWETDTGLDEFIALPKNNGNAAQHYAKLASWYEQEKDAKTGKIQRQFDELVRKPTTEYKAGGISEILAAVQIKECRLVPDFYKPIVDRNVDMPNSRMMMAYVDALKRCAAALEKVTRYAEADELHRAIIIMGWHFTEDRPNLAVYSMGLTIQNLGCEAYSPYLVRRLEMKRSRACDQYRKFLARIFRAVNDKNTRFLNQWARFYSLEACIKCAAEDAEPLWRQEAALNLSVMQNGYPDSEGNFIYHDPVQQQAAREALEKMATTDPQENI